MYIPSIDAKDIYISNHYVKSNPIGYRITKKDNTLNLNKFINSFDNSLDLIELKGIAEKIYDGMDTLSFKKNGKEYSSKIINVTFKYSNKEFNNVAKNTYVKFGYDYRDLLFEDNIARNFHNEIVGVIINTPVCTPVSEELLLPYFKIHKTEKETTYATGRIQNLNSVKDLRNILYKDGFYCNGLHYIRFKRTSGSARVGKCLFIDDRLYPDMHTSEKCGLDINPGDELDLAAWEAYISLPTSSIIDTIQIEPKNILLIDDYESVFTEEAAVTEVGDDGWLYTEQKKTEICNSIWDGQSLIDKSLLGVYEERGMVLLRNKFFKSCCFNSNLQQWFKDNSITKIEQLNGQTLAKNIEDIKLITTPNSIKYLKFGNFMQWINNLPSTFGVVKHDKKTHFFDGELVSTHYQLLNTLQLTFDEVEELLKPSFEYLDLLNTDIDVLKYHIKCKTLDENDDNVMMDKNEIIYKMLNYDCGFEGTKLFYDFKRELIKSYVKNMKKGHILINGTYATLLGNPYEMLLSAIGKFDGASTLAPGTVHNTRYEYGKKLLGCRSPHVTMGNILITTNVEHVGIDKYINLTDQIICINSICENILQRLSGSDFDSDQLIITDHSLLIKAALKNYGVFKVPTCNVSASKRKRFYTPEQLADLDIKTSENKIGEIVNMSQILNSMLWSTVNNNKVSAAECYSQIKELYLDVCQLDVISSLEIDKAKKEYPINCARELNKIKEKYYMSDSSGREIKPSFMGFIAQTKGYRNPEKKCYLHHATTMDFLYRCINKRRSKRNQGSEFIPFSAIFAPLDFCASSVNWRQVKTIIDSVVDVKNFINSVWSRDEYDNNEKYLLSNMAKQELVHEIENMKINKSTMYTLITYIDNPKYSEITRLLFTTLFNYRNETIVDLIRDKKMASSVLEKYDGNGVEIYGMTFVKRFL